MWNLLKKRNEECMKLQDLMEDSAAARPEAVHVEELCEAWPAAQRAHIAACGTCQEAAQDLFAAREIFKGVASRAEQAAPRVVRRGMGAIRTPGRAPALPAGLLSAVPRSS